MPAEKASQSNIGGTSFSDIGAPPLPVTPLSFFLYFIKKYQAFLWVMILMEVTQKLTQVALPFAMGNLLDEAVEVVRAGEEGTFSSFQDFLFWPPFAFFLMLSVGTVLVSRISGALLVMIAPALRRFVRRQLYHFMQYQSHRYFTSHFAGSLANRINEVSLSVNHALWTLLFDFLPVATGLTYALILLYKTHIGLFWFLGFWSTAYIVVSFLLSRRCQTYSKSFAAERSRTTGHIVDVVTNMMNTKLFAKLGHERSRLEGQLTQELNQARRTLWFMEKMRWFQFISTMILQVGLLWMALRYFLEDSLTAGQFIMVSTQGLLLIEDARGLSRRFLEFFEYMGNISDGVDVLVRRHEIIDAPNAKKLTVKKRRDPFFKN